MINNHKIIVLNRQGRLKHWFILEIWIMNRFYDRFDTHKWIDLAEADYLSDKDDFSMIFLDRCNRLRLLCRNVWSGCHEFIYLSLSVLCPLWFWFFFYILLLYSSLFVLLKCSSVDLLTHGGPDTYNKTAKVFYFQ